MSNYYHYTNQTGYNAIKETNQINPSLDTRRDAALGPGVYFSQKPPQTSNEKLVQSNYGSSTPDLVAKTQYYVKIPSDQLTNVQCANSSTRNICLASTTEPIQLEGLKGVKFGERKRYE